MGSESWSYYNYDKHKPTLNHTKACSRLKSMTVIVVTVTITDALTMQALRASGSRLCGLRNSSLGHDWCSWVVSYYSLRCLGRHFCNIYRLCCRYDSNPTLKRTSRKKATKLAASGRGFQPCSAGCWASVSRGLRVEGQGRVCMQSA